MLGHDWGEWAVTKEATHDKAGEMKRTCKNDPTHIETKNLSKLPYTLTFNLGEGTWNRQTGIITMEYEKGASITLPIPTRDGYVFDYWQGSRYEGSQSYTVTDNHTFTAIWKQVNPTTPTRVVPNTGAENDLSWLTGAASFLLLLMVLSIRRFFQDMNNEI